jgi:hypothetical protein
VGILVVDVFLLITQENIVDKLKKIKKVKVMVSLFLVFGLISPALAFSSSPSSPEGMAMVPGGAFLMGVDKDLWRLI